MLRIEKDNSPNIPRTWFCGSPSYWRQMKDYQWTSWQSGYWPPLVGKTHGEDLHCIDEHNTWEYPFPHQYMGMTWQTTCLRLLELQWKCEQSPYSSCCTQEQVQNIGHMFPSLLQRVFHCKWLASALHKKWQAFSINIWFLWKGSLANSSGTCASIADVMCRCNVVHQCDEGEWMNCSSRQPFLTVIYCWTAKYVLNKRVKYTLRKYGMTICIVVLRSRCSDYKYLLWQQVLVLATV